MNRILIIAVLAVYLPLFAGTNGNEPKLKVPEKKGYLRSFFNKERAGEGVTVSIEGKEMRMYTTRNIEFYNSVLKPVIKDNLPALQQLNYSGRVNVLIKFIFEAYRTYLGKSFYRWGGDLFDLDDAQGKGVRFDARFGLDCSGFAASAYEAAVDMGLLPAKDSISVFAHTGFEYIAPIKGYRDGGGRDDASNRFRPDSKELAFLGRELFNIPQNGVPTKEQIALLQPGDLVSAKGHVGIIAFINGKPYYYESGGVVVSKNNGKPAPAAKSLAKFARKGPLSIRRALPDAAGY